MSNPFVYGIHAVHALLLNRFRKTKLLHVTSDRTDKRIQALLDLASQHHVPVQSHTTKQMDQRFPNLIHQGVVAEASALIDYNEHHLDELLSQAKNPCLILILDGVTDPHNLGACLRSADAAGVDFVIIPKDKNASITAVVSKVACGAAESVPLVRVTNLARTMTHLKQEGVWMYGAAGESPHVLYDLDCQTSIALVLGAEDTGMRRLTREHCDGLFSLPMLGSVSSLNVSVATGVCLYEVVRKRRFS